MQQIKSNQGSPIPTKAILIGMIGMYIIVHIGFYLTYIKHFPEFTGFRWLHHIHGSLMGSWVLLLVVQPLLIHKHKYVAHRFIGRLTYLIAPLMVVTMVLVARLNYLKGIVDSSSQEVFSRQSITWMQIFLFTFFYSLAIYYRKDTQKHLRFMIATAIVMIGPAMSRIIFTYWGDARLPYNVIIPLCIKTAIAASLWMVDVTKKLNWKPYAIVLSAFILADIAYYARYSDLWQALGKLVIHTLY